MGVEERVLAYLRGSPGATPREIADALGVSLGAVRVALVRLREAGLVVRSSRGGYVARVSGARADADLAPASTPGGSVDAASLVRTISELVGRVNEIAERLSRLESEVRHIKRSLPEAGVAPRRAEEDRLLAALKLRGILGIEEARSMASRPLEEYVGYGRAVVVGEFVVSPEFLSRLRSKFPIRVSELSSLSPEEQELLRVLVKTGYAYLHSGSEYRYLGAT